MLDVSRIRHNRLSVRPRPTELSSLVKRAVGQLSAARRPRPAFTSRLEACKP